MATGSWLRDEQHTVPSLLERRLESDPDGEYLDVTGTKLTAAEVEATANRLANALAELGLRPGDRVATLIDNSPEALLAWWGALRGGFVAVPINTAYKGDFLRHQLVDSGSRVLFVDAGLADRAAAVGDGVAELEHVVISGDGSRDDVALAGARAHRWEDLLTVDDKAPSVDISPSDLGTFVYTGGTTGPSKGCMLSHNYHGALARQIGLCWERTAADVVWTPLPLFHFNALTTVVCGTLLFGGRGAIYRRFSVSDFWPEMNRVGATITSTLGTMAYLLAHDVDRPEMPRSGRPEANATLPDLQRGLRRHRGQPHLVAAPGRAQPPRRRRRRQRRVLRHPHLRRRRQRAAARRRRRDRRPPQAPPRHVRGLLGPAGGDGREQPQLVVPHR
jgi:crotonobetaine/carnitine-CoA ligase